MPISPDRSIYPLHEHAAFVQESEIRTYLDMLFQGIEWRDGKYMNFRGIGEKGTAQEGTFRDDKIFQPFYEDPLKIATNCTRRWGTHHAATFIVPCVLKGPRGSSENAELFTVILGDLDTGDTAAKLAHLTAHCGAPTMVVESGGLTDEGTPKLHVYYRLQVPCADVALVVNLRDQMARRAGGDLQFGLGVPANPYGRAHQPIRLPGSCHAKGGAPRRCRILTYRPEAIFALEDLSEAVDGMPYGPWYVAPSEGELPVAGNPVTGAIFSPTSGAGAGSSVKESLIQDVAAGGEGTTRFSEFSKVAGHYLHCVREGQYSLEGAKEKLEGWVAAHMIPPWPAGRVDREFDSLKRVDSQKNGPFPSVPTADPAFFTKPSFGALGIHEWAAHRWVTDPKPSHTFLVDRLVIKGEPHLMVSEGGAGKTFSALDLGMKIAAWSPEFPLEWCGQSIRSSGTVVECLNEDSRTELHIRMMEIDQRGLIQRAGPKLIVIPMNDAGGSFPLVEYDRHTRRAVATARWEEFLAALATIGDLVLVVIDTLNSVSHGDENSALVIAELMRQAGRVLALPSKPALLVNHHVRKSNEAIRSLHELKESIRGNSAIPNYFRVCFGMFAAADYDRRMRAMDRRPVKGALWRFGIAKANINGLMQGEKTLLRNEVGLLMDCTAADKFNHINTSEREAWLIAAVKLAVEAGHPYKNGGKQATDGLYRRRSELPPILRKVGGTEFAGLVENALQDEKLVLCAKGGNAKSYLDVPEGPLATDSPDSEVKKGAYLDIPDWDQYAFCTLERVVLHRDDIRNPFPLGPGHADMTSFHVEPAPTNGNGLYHMKGARVDD